MSRHYSGGHIGEQLSRACNFYAPIVCRAIFIGVVATTAQRAFADTYTVYGTAVTVDSVSPVDSSSVKLTIRGESRIVSKSDANYFVLERLLGAPDASLRIVTQQIGNIAEQALKADDYKAAALAFNALLEREDSSEAHFEGLATNLARLPKFNAFVRELFLKLSSNANLAGLVRLLAEIQSSDLQEMLPGIEGFVNERRAALSEALHARYLSLISAKAYDAAERVYLAADRICSPSGEISKLRLERSAVTDILLATRNLDAAGLIALRHNVVVGATREVRGVLSDGLHEIARQALNRHRFRDALQILSTIDVNQVTPATHELLQEALVKGVADGVAIGEILGDLPVALMLRSLAQANPKLAGIYSDILDSSVRRSSSSFADAAFTELLQVRPDPSIANDDLRYAIAVNHLWRGDRGAARQMLSASKTPHGGFRKIKLFALGYFISPLILYPGLLTAIFLTGFAVLRNRAATIAAEKAEARRVVERTSGFKGAGLPGSESRLEYLGLLREFGLPPEATLKDIKSMYRSKVKVHHPDASGDDHASDDFLQMNEKYERLVSLYSQLME